MSVLATIVLEFGSGANADDSLALIELDDVVNVDSEWQVMTSFAPGDEPGFFVHFDTKALKIDRVESSAGMIVGSGQIVRERDQQMTWANNEDSKDLPHIPQGGVSCNWFGTQGVIVQTGRKLQSIGNVPSVCDASYSFAATGYTLIPPSMDLGPDEKFPVFVVVYMVPA